MIEKYLQDLEARIHPGEEERLLESWIDFSFGRCQTPLFAPRRVQPKPSQVEWPDVSINAALDDFDLMVLQQFRACSETLASASGQMLNVRCNYGTAIMPSLFGAELFIMDESLHTLPTCWPVGEDAVQRLLDAGIPDLANGYGGLVLAMGERFAEIAGRYPKIGKYVFIYHPDLQGPMDICELLWGSKIFYALVDQPELVHALLDLVTQTYIRFMEAWCEIVPFRVPGNAHWGLYQRGNLMLRDDSAMNLSSGMVAEFVLPYDQRLLDRFDGGAIHFCGKGDHFIQAMSDLRGLYAVNLSQPALNDMDTVYKNTVEKGINLLGLQREALVGGARNGRGVPGRIHVFDDGRSTENRHLKDMTG